MSPGGVTCDECLDTFSARNGEGAGEELRTHALAEVVGRRGRWWELMKYKLGLSVGEEF